MKHPNLILLVMDSVRATNLSCYGYSRETTPNIDALAREGVRYENAFSVGCWTLPVHTSLFTGLYPLNHNVLVSRAALPEGVPTLAGQLRDLGYQTASFSNNPYISSITGLARGFETTEDLWRTTKPHGIKRSKSSQVIQALERLGAAGRPATRLFRQARQVRSALRRQHSRQDQGARLTHERMLAWLSESRQPGRPFFWFVNYMETHEPYRPPYPYNRRFMPKDISAWRIAQLGDKKDILQHLSEERGQQDLEILRGLYDGELSYLDFRIGELSSALHALGLLEDTVLVITSDHGDSLGEHQHLGHRLALYEQLVHVPLIVRYPAHFQSGTTVTQDVSLIDLYPTFLELAGDERSRAKSNGFHSLLSLPPVETRPFLIAENTAPKSQDSVVARMIRASSHKFIWRSDGRHELYDLAVDPGELENLVDRQPEVAARMKEQLDSWMAAHEGVQVETNRAEYDEIVLERLRDLGYVD